MKTEMNDKKTQSNSLPGKVKWKLGFWSLATVMVLAGFKPQLNSQSVDDCELTPQDSANIAAGFLMHLQPNMGLRTAQSFAFYPDRPVNAKIVNRRFEFDPNLIAEAYFKLENLEDLSGPITCEMAQKICTAFVQFTNPADSSILVLDSTGLRKVLEPIIQGKLPYFKENHVLIAAMGRHKGNFDNDILTPNSNQTTVCLTPARYSMKGSEMPRDFHEFELVKNGDYNVIFQTWTKLGGKTRDQNQEAFNWFFQSANTDGSGKCITQPGQ